MIKEVQPENTNGELDFDLFCKVMNDNRLIVNIDLKI